MLIAMSSGSSYKDRIAARKSRLLAPSAVAATVALGSIASSAQAAISYHLTPGVSGGFLSLNPLTGDTSISFGVSDTYPISAGACTTNLVLLNEGNLGSGLHTVMLSSGDIVDENLSYGTSDLTGRGTLPFGDDFYIGFRFTGQGTNNDETYYGYMQLFSDTPNNIELIGYAIGGNNEAVPISPVPEPATYALGFGVLALMGCLLAKRLGKRLSAASK
ncbi:hypothetical protein H5P28_07810 [Ruficoccus amylovorans]|uniref:PEP-CTERM sorting domain-containing protein n=1 Tax=Ruficoccus amylovorans TaxID=1804625 RepID=A0A842HEU4_9BACT|nr:hypothetical protein [Ruficoccus amylovorans]MBC2594166.1 hypothetical protein [Ruficoccus amylovorans]